MSVAASSHQTMSFTKEPPELGRRALLRLTCFPESTSNTWRRPVRVASPVRRARGLPRLRKALLPLRAKRLSEPGTTRSLHTLRDLLLIANVCLLALGSRTGKRSRLARLEELLDTWRRLCLRGGLRSKSRPRNALRWRNHRLRTSHWTGSELTTS